MTSALIVGLLLVALNGSPEFGPRRQSLCFSRDVRVIQPGEISSVELSRFQFTSTDRGSFASLDLTNRGSKTISSVILLLDLLDAENGYLLTVPYYTQPNSLTDALINENRDWFFHHNGQQLRRPLANGDRVNFFVSTQFTTPQCPVLARITAMKLEFSDGMQEQYFATEWNLGPAVVEAQHLRQDNLPLEVPYAARFRLRIDAAGHGTVLEVRGPPEVKTWLQEQVDHWILFPRLTSGRAVESEVLILLRIHRSSTEDDIKWDWNGERVTKELIVMDAIPRDQGKKWLVLAGGGPATLEPIR